MSRTASRSRSPHAKEATRTGRVVPNGLVGDWRLGSDDFMAAFSLPGAAEKHDALARLHPLPRDERIRFFEEEHVYKVDGLDVPCSVTALAHCCSPSFDQELAVRLMRRGRQWPQKRLLYLRPDGSEMSDAEIMDRWQRNGREQAARGTLMHWHIERFYNGDDVDAPRSPEFEQFLDFNERWFKARGLRAWRTEVSLFHCGLGVAGQADMLALDKEGKVVILDWKRARDLALRSSFKEKLLPPLAHLDRCNYNEYCLQLNLYRYFLETEYDLEVSEMHLAVFHPGQEAFATYEVPRMPSEIEAIVALARTRGAEAPLPGPLAPFVVRPDMVRFRH